METERWGQGLGGAGVGLGVFLSEPLPGKMAVAGPDLSLSEAQLGERWWRSVEEEGSHGAVTLISPTPILNSCNSASLQFPGRNYKRGRLGFRRVASRPEFEARSMAPLQDAWAHLGSGVFVSSVHAFFPPTETVLSINCCVEYTEPASQPDSWSRSSAVACQSQRLVFFFQRR